MSDDLSRRRRRYTSKRAENMTLWVDEPLQNLIRDELARREWTISDLARKIGSQPSLVSRWMQGQRPNTESLRLVGEALGLDERKLLILSGHLSASGEEDEDERLASLFTKLRQAAREGHLTDERCLMLDTLIEWIRVTPATTPHNNRPADHQAPPLAGVG